MTPNLAPQYKQHPASMSGSTTNVKLHDLSVVGREIISSQVKAPPKGNGMISQQQRNQATIEQQSAKESSDGNQSRGNDGKSRFKAQTAEGLPID